VPSGTDHADLSFQREARAKARPRHCEGKYCSFLLGANPAVVPFPCGRHVTIETRSISRADLYRHNLPKRVSTLIPTALHFPQR